MARANINSQYAIDVDAALVETDTAGNRHRYYARVYHDKLSGSGAWTLAPTQFGVTAPGLADNTARTYDFRGVSRILLWEAFFWVTNNSDGSGVTFKVAASRTMASPASGYAEAEVNITTPRIARASSARFRNNDGWFEPGTQVPIDISRASSSFTHDITWQFGTKSGTVANGVGTSVTWTPPADMLTEIPTAPYGNGHINVFTRSGGALIGTTRTNFFASAAGAKPTIAGVSASDDNPNVASIVGAYVQGMSLLKATVDATSPHGGTVPTRSFTVDGTTAPSGKAVPLDVAGTRTVTADVVDSRSQSATWTGQISVLPYAPPDIRAMTAQRATAAGSPNGDGTYLRIDLEAAVSSLVNGTQRNSIRVAVFTRQGGTTTWIARNVINPAGLTHDAGFVVSGGGIFDINRSYDVRVEVSDKFAVSQKIVTVTTSPVLMDFNGDKGVGIGKRHELGLLDVAGPIYQNAQKVADEPGVQAAITARHIGTAVTTTGTQTSASTTPVVVTGLSVPVTVPAGGATLRFTINLTTYSGNLSDVVAISLRDGSTDIRTWTRAANSSATTVGTGHGHSLVMTIDGVTAGSHTYRVCFLRAAGSSTVTAAYSDTSPATLTVERT